MCIHLLSTINADYLIPFRITVHSLVANMDTTTPIKWHIYESGIMQASKQAIESQASGKPLEFVWHDAPVERTAMLPTRGRLVPHVYARLLAIDLLPADIERIIYLDGDLLIRSAINTLWELKLDGAILGAVQDLAIPLVSSPMGLQQYADLGFEADHPYFNAGVFVVDTAAWKTHEIGSRALAYLEQYQASINLMDQDALNAVIRNRWKPLDYRWNVIAGLAGRSHYDPVGVDRVQLEGAINDPAIIHFAGYLKPWIHPQLGSRWADAYVETLQRVFPNHQLDQTAKARGASLYDRRLRRLLYPVEKFIWKKRRGF